MPKRPLAFIPLFATQLARYLPVMLFSLLLFSLAHADCPDVVVSTTQAVDALVAARLEEAEAALQRAELGFSCGTPPSPESLARFWLAEAAVASVTGQEEDARDAWQAAARLAPDLWDPRYGPELRGKRDAAVAAMGRGQGTLRLEPLPEKHQLVVDGAVTPNPTPVTEGLHLVQLTRRDLVYGKVVLIGADENMQVRPVIAEPEDVPPKGRKVAMIAGGGIGVAAGAGLLVVAARQDAPMEEARTSWRAGELTSDDANAQVEQRWNVQRTAGGAGYALATLGLVGIGFGIVW